MIVLEAFVEAYRLRKDIGALHKLDDRTLEDLGITRSGIEAAVRYGDRKATVPQGVFVTRPRAKAA